MKTRTFRLTGILLLSGLLGLLLGGNFKDGTWLELTEDGTGRRVSAVALKDGEEVLLTWRNSLFNLEVTEVFHARRGQMVLDQVTFADPQGHPPPVVGPAEVEDYYHTGGPFTARGLGRPFTRVVHRVGEIGNPRLKIGNRWVAFKEEVGFGGGVVLTATPAGFLKTVLGGH